MPVILVVFCVGVVLCCTAVRLCAVYSSVVVCCVQHTTTLRRALLTLFEQGKIVIYFKTVSVTDRNELLTACQFCCYFLPSTYPESRFVA